jgi:hypothetical protein
MVLFSAISQFSLPPSKWLYGHSLFEMDSKRTKALMFYCECMEVSPETIRPLDLKRKFVLQYAVVAIKFWLSCQSFHCPRFALSFSVYSSCSFFSTHGTHERRYQRRSQRILTDITEEQLGLTYSYKGYISYSSTLFAVKMKIPIELRTFALVCLLFYLIGAVR